MRALYALTIALALAAPAWAQEQPIPTPDAAPPPPLDAGPEPTTEPAPPPEPPPEPPKPPREPEPPRSVNADLYDSLPALDLPAVDPDTLAFGSTLEMIAAGFNLETSGTASDDVDNESHTFGLNLSTRYFGSLEKTNFGYSVVVTASDRFARGPSAFDPQDESLYTNDFALNLSPEGRFYLVPQRPFFAFGGIDFDVDVNSVMDTGATDPFGGPLEDEFDSEAPGSLSVVFGLGAGRVLNIDPIVRLKRIDQALGPLLRSAISAEVGSEIIRHWYALRNDLDVYRHLAYTMKHLQGANLLAGDPDLRATYQAIAVLNDPFIFNRRHGWDARMGLAVVKTFVGYDDLDVTEPDAVYALVASAQYERPMGTERQASLRAKLFIDAGDADGFDGAERPYSLRLFGAFTQVFYTENYVPTGSLSVTGELGYSDERQPDFLPDREAGIDLIAQFAYSRALNRGSLGTASTVLTAQNDGDYTFTLNLGITWGVASGFYTPYNAAVVGL